MKLQLSSHRVKRTAESDDPAGIERTVLFLPVREGTRRSAAPVAAAAAAAAAAGGGGGGGGGGGARGGEEGGERERITGAPPIICYY